MSANVPVKQRVHRMLRKSRCFLPAALRFGRPLPKAVILSPGEEILGGIWGSKLESILTDRGAYLRTRAGWTFVAYNELEEVVFPDKSDPSGAVALQTVKGDFELLSGRSELWTVGSFFMRCMYDAKTQVPE